LKKKEILQKKVTVWRGSGNSMCFSVLKLCTVWYGASLGGPKLVNRYILWFFNIRFDKYLTASHLSPFWQEQKNPAQNAFG
jgi:hypothetical protein